MKRIRSLAVLAGILTLGTLAGSGLWRAHGHAGWTMVSPGLDTCTFRVGQGANIVALRAPAGRIHVAVGASLDAPGWRQRLSGAAAINGGFFDRSGKSLGLRVADGHRYNHLHKADWGVFFIREGTAHILHTHDFSRLAPSLRGVRDAVQCGPRLVVDGQPTRLKPQFARRTGIGVQSDGRVIIAVADDPVSLQDWAAAWAARDGLNCRDALNLDGGPSTQLSLKAPSRSLEIRGGWPVPDAVVIK